jgi:hypothetical protein|tara:strand:- start:533 stop:763 length:231 start_codon:yes stop_codon:yes gene_type:complete
MVKDFWYSIAWLFEEVLFFPFDFLRTVQFDSWFFANIMSWFFILIGIIGSIYWIKQLKKFDDRGEEKRDITAHPFL